MFQAQHERVLVHVHIGQLALRIDLEPLPAGSSTWRRSLYPGMHAPNHAEPVLRYLPAMQ